MKVTNKLNLPAAFVNAVSVDRHNAPNCYSATTLNKGTREIILCDRHHDEIEIDASDSVWAVWGTAVHALLEKQPDNNFHEEFFSTSVSNSKVTGCVDSYDLESGTLYDWKTASVWKVMTGDFEDWKKQGLTYAWLMNKNDLTVKKCVFIALLKDHSKTKAQNDAHYPQSPVITYEFDVTTADLEATEKRIIDKIKTLEAASVLADEMLPLCSDDERWADGEKYAVMKKGRQTAVKLFDVKADAEARAAELGAAHYVEHRPATSRKCAGYCPAKDFCSYMKNGGK